MTIITTTKVMRPRDPHDFYPTPLPVCEAAINLIPSYVYPRTILDPGAGAGPWGVAARQRWPYADITGCELRADAEPPQGAYSAWFQADYLAYNGFASRDLIIGNPPYKFAEPFITKSLSLLNPGGYIIFLLRLAFLEGQARGAGLWHDSPPMHVAVCSARPSFTGNGKTDATAYAIFLWSKGWRGTPTLSWLQMPQAQTALFD